MKLALVALLCLFSMMVMVMILLMMVASPARGKAHGNRALKRRRVRLLCAPAVWPPVTTAPHAKLRPQYCDLLGGFVPHLNAQCTVNEVCKLCRYKKLPLLLGHIYFTNAKDHTNY